MSLTAADGSRFQEMLQDPSLASFFQEPRNLLFAICIDGMNPYNSGTYSLTPMLLQHLGLPAHVSSPQDTCVFSTLWYFVRSALHVAHRGVLWQANVCCVYLFLFLL